MQKFYLLAIHLSAVETKTSRDVGTNGTEQMKLGEMYRP